MNITVAHHRLAVLLCPSFGEEIEIQRRGKHRVVLDRVEQIGVAPQAAAQRMARRKERVRRDHEAPLARLESPHVIERPDALGAVREIQQQHVPSLDRALDARNEHDAVLAGVRDERPGRKLTIVKRHRERTVAKRGRAVDQLMRRMRDAIEGIVGRVGVELYLNHHLRGIHNSCRSVRPAGLLGRSYRIPRRSTSRSLITASG